MDTIQTPAVLYEKLKKVLGGGNIFTQLLCIHKSLSLFRKRNVV